MCVCVETDREVDIIVCVWREGGMGGGRGEVSSTIPHSLRNKGQPQLTFTA